MCACLTYANRPLCLAVYQGSAVAEASSLTGSDVLIFFLYFRVHLVLLLVVVAALR